MKNPAFKGEGRAFIFVDFCFQAENPIVTYILI
jgi:hypothetical protein